MKIIKDFGELKSLFLLFSKHPCIVIIARYNYGKSSYCTDEILKHFKDVLYATFIDQSKPNFQPRKSQLSYGQMVENKIIIFDEISDDEGRDIGQYLSKLMEKNKLIILSNPYGSSDDPEKEVKLFKEHESLPQNTLYIYVLNNFKD